VKTGEEDAVLRDVADPGHRDLFHIPPASGGAFPETAYLAGNSLGLQPRAIASDLLAELAAWERLGVEGHFEADRPWFSYHELLTEPAARLVGALPIEVVAMNSLTVNLHLLMVSFYRPTGGRTRIVVEDTTFPSDSYAVRSQAAFHGLDPDEAVVRLRSPTGADRLSTDDIVAYLDRHGGAVALMLLGGVNYLTGELLDIRAITAAGHAAGAIVGWDLAHAAGNVPLGLHDWGVDFAAWCSYKYLNAGPGAVAGAFVHERHLATAGLPRFEGWWSTSAATRFEMAPVAQPPASADAWQVSNPPILAMSPLRTSLELFDKVGMAALRERSVRLTGYLAGLLDGIIAVPSIEVVTPRDAVQRGAQLSVRIGHGGVGEIARRLRHEHGVIADTRNPDVIRFAPVPLYSTYHDCWRAVAGLAAVLSEST
jgi:kynureninase